ncbi:protein NETWORKED 3A-like [Humulus lupulus]|uniref:protein NETWORKED 3A-like n=1 Tax=Humulus lupulus TaxID=3486 RepID=UPI002B406E22|nr:protein NETWORKED 3A-like [Humulus lupulus]
MILINQTKQIYYLYIDIQSEKGLILCLKKKVEEKMEEDNKGDQVALPMPWWWCPCDTSYSSHRHSSLWLHATLSELDENIKTMVSILEEDGDSFAKRAEMYYQRRPQLIEVLNELHNSYRWLAEKYDQLIIRSQSQSHDHNVRPRPVIKSLRQLHQRKYPLQEDNNNNNNHNADDGDMKKTRSDERFYDLEIINGGGDDDDDDAGKIWRGKEVSELTEEHLRQQDELIRRNEKKRERIKELSSQVKRLMEENGALKACLANRNHSSRHSHCSKAFFFGKLTGCSR